MPDAHAIAELPPTRLPPVRLDNPRLLACGGRGVGTLSVERGRSAVTVSHHLGKLNLPGLLGARCIGKRQQETGL